MNVQYFEAHSLSMGKAPSVSVLKPNHFYRSNRLQQLALLGCKGPCRLPQEEVMVAFMLLAELLGRKKPVEDGERSISLVEATQRALQLQDSNPRYIVKGTARSGAEFFNARSYHGLEMHSEKSVPQPFVIGRTGKASGYQNEKENREIL
ncbi:hypothetical protein Syun_005913 [Stephania yunnanensis]|uniref:Uncharacterized protein n=1 Tax=Stephania yunnanensis TaxID=152371 RepID=A0AAP0KXD0_9MAGN